jgi:ubiquinone/menaquinone biosynthesis C-methylase UbiE
MSVIDYYNQIASSYDASRFANSYGRYIDRCERDILDLWLRGRSPKEAIDFGCGTGRLLDYAMTGLDGSSEMLSVAAQKFPDRRLIHADLTQIPDELHGFSGATCFHVMMHLQPEQIENFLQRAARTIRPGGHLIVDFMSAPRRQLLRKQKVGWHGNTALRIANIAALAGDQWQLVQWRGILMLPIHRFPAVVRPLLAKIDHLLCRSFLAPYASYYVVKLERRA